MGRSIAVSVWLLFTAAGILRCVDLEHNPPGLWQDEASTGLDAYLLWTTGRDRHGAFLPVASRSFGDYPLALYRMLAAPWVGLLGPSPQTERLPAALAGWALVALSALWLHARGRSQPMPRFAPPAVLFTVGWTPICLFFSRYGSEAILLPACLMLAVWATEGPRPPPWRLWLAAGALVASAYTYHAVKAFLPLWLLPFLWFRRDLLRSLAQERPVHLGGPALAFLAGLAPSLWFALTEGGMARPGDVAAWVHHPWSQVPYVVLNNTLSYFDPGFLFVRGGPHLGQSVPGMGLFHLIELPLAIVGGAEMHRRDRRAFGFWFAWFVLGPVPGGLTYETQNVGRAIGWLPVISLWSGLGLASLMDRTLRWSRSPSQRARLAGLGLAAALGLGVSATAAWTVQRFFRVYPQVAQPAFQFGIAAPLECARQLHTDERVVVSPQLHYARTFGRFYFAPWARERGPGALTFRDPRTLDPDELYIAPADRPRPRRAVPVCAVESAGGVVVGRVWAGRAGPRRTATPASP